PFPKHRLLLRLPLQIPAPPIPPVAPRRAPARNVFLPPKRHAAVPAVPRLHVNFCFVNKHKVSLSFQHSALSRPQTKTRSSLARPRKQPLSSQKIVFNCEL